MTLLQMQSEWNRLVAVARGQGITNVRPWEVPPHNAEYGRYRINALRARLSLPPLGETLQVERAMTLAEIRDAYNALVPQALERGLRGVRPWTGPVPSVFRGMRRLNRLRQQLGVTTAVIDPRIVAEAAVAEFVTTDFDFSAWSFGAEFEFYLPEGGTTAPLAAKLQQAGIEVQIEGYNHIRRRHWKIVTDGSLWDNMHGRELVSPPLRGEAGLAEVRKVCEVLTAHGCRIRKQAGFHVHVGAVNEVSFFKNLARVYRRFEPMIDTLMAPSRRGTVNRWSRPLQFNEEKLVRARTIHSVVVAFGEARAAHERRYCKLNYESYGRHGTVEFRQHQGTVDADKAINWIMFCVRLCALAKKDAGQSLDVTLDSLLKAIGASEAERAFFIKRHADLNGGAQVVEEVANYSARPTTAQHEVGFFPRVAIGAVSGMRMPPSYNERERDAETEVRHPSATPYEAVLQERVDLPIREALALARDAEIEAREALALARERENEAHRLAGRSITGRDYSYQVDNRMVEQHEGATLNDIMRHLRRRRG